MMDTTRRTSSDLAIELLNKIMGFGGIDDSTPDPDIILMSESKHEELEKIVHAVFYKGTAPYERPIDSIFGIPIEVCTDVREMSERFLEFATDGFSVKIVR